MSNKLSAILIPGNEHNLKTPKMLLPFGESTVLRRTLEAYLASDFEEIILVVPDRADEVRESLGPLADRISIQTPADANAQVGIQLRAGVGAVSSSSKGFAIALADQPLLDPELIQDLVRRFGESKKKILVPVCQGTIGHPAFFHSSFLRAFAELPPDGQTWDVLRAHGDDVDDHHLFASAVIRNIDDLDDYHDLLEMAGLPVPEIEEEETEPAADRAPDSVPEESGDVPKEPGSISAVEPGNPGE
jgi:molybdenum cofactor cytidylyltransferase